MMEEWNDGMMEGWKDGRMERWGYGILTCQVSRACGRKNLLGLTKLKNRKSIEMRVGRVRS
jgi:hypothetical protein